MVTKIRSSLASADPSGESQPLLLDLNSSESMQRALQEYSQREFGELLDAMASRESTPRTSIDFSSLEPRRPSENAVSPEEYAARIMERLHSFRARKQQETRESSLLENYALEESPANDDQGVMRRQFDSLLVSRRPIRNVNISSG